jgi:Kdo2-lipid IVA lauroyltransferase/acyltransferase
VWETTKRFPPGGLRPLARTGAPLFVTVVKRIRYHLEWLCLLVFARAVPQLSRRVCVLFANALGDLVFALDRRGRRIALANIEAAFGNKYSIRERRRIARASYQIFARSCFDLFWSTRLNSENYAEYLMLDNAELAAKLRATGRGAMFFTAHEGIFEWSSFAVAFTGWPPVVVAESFKNPLLTGIFTKRRELAGIRVLPQQSSMIRLLKHIKRGGSSGILIDLNLPPTQAATVIECFGMKTCVTFLHAMLAQRGAAFLVPVSTEPLQDGRCRAIFHSPIEVTPEDTLQEITQRCWDFFEQMIRNRPELWMWAYKHWRYRPKDATRPYPFYANVSSKFEKLMIAAKNLTKPA